MLVRHLGEEVDGCKRVEANVVARQFQSKRLAELDDAGLGCGIVAALVAHAQAEDRGDIDDAAAAVCLD
ncbi:hypothetical protein D3C78_1781120 [compost metagenome]